MTGFKGSGITRKSASRILQDDLNCTDYRKLLYRGVDSPKAAGGGEGIRKSSSLKSGRFRFGSRLLYIFSKGNEPYGEGRRTF